MTSTVEFRRPVARPLPPRGFLRGALLLLLLLAGFPRPGHADSAGPGGRPGAAPRAAPDSPPLADSPAVPDSLAASARRAIKEDSLSRKTLSKAEALVRANDSLSRVDSLRRDSIRSLMELVGRRDTLRISRLQHRLDSISAADSVRRLNRQLSLERLRTMVTAYPVILNQDTLFHVHLRRGAFSAPERAKAISRRLAKIAFAPGTVADSIQRFSGEFTSDIVYMESVLMSVSEGDALWFDRTRDELAEEYAGIMRRAVAEFQQAHSLSQVFLEAAKLAVAFLLFGIFLFSVRRSSRWLRRRILRDPQGGGLTVRNVELLTPDQQRAALVAAVRLLEATAYLITTFLCLLLFFSVVPSTRDWIGRPSEWLLAPLVSILRGTLGYLPSLFGMVVIIAFTALLVKLARKVSDAVGRGAVTVNGFYPDWARPTFNIVRFLAYALAFIAILPLLPGSGAPLFLGVSVFLALLLALASAPVAANFVAGLALTYMRPFRVGDRVKVGEATGVVMEISALATRLRTPQDEIVTVPNSTLIKHHTVNYSSASGPGPGPGLQEP